MFSCFSDIVRNHNEYQNACIRRILWNTTTTNKISTKALSAILDAMKLIRSPPVDSCSEAKSAALLLLIPVVLYHCTCIHTWFVMSQQYA